MSNSKTTYYLETFLEQTCGAVKMAEQAFDDMDAVVMAYRVWTEQLTAKGERGFCRVREVTR